MSFNFGLSNAKISLSVVKNKISAWAQKFLVP